MTLYEIMIIKQDGQRETRYTDHPPNIGDTIVVDGRQTTVVSRLPNTLEPLAAERFVCEERA
jgi:hypothetical protein